MTAVLVDSNILLDVLTQDRRWRVWSERALETAANRGRLVINAIVYAEVSVRFSRIEDLDDALAWTPFDREPLPFEAAFIAGKSHLRYRQSGGTKLSPLPDFFIGAHASIAGYRLMTRDIAHYRTYFPNLEFIAPE